MKKKQNRICFDLKGINRSLLVELMINLLIVPEFINLSSWPKKNDWYVVNEHTTCGFNWKQHIGFATNWSHVINKYSKTIIFWNYTIQMWKEKKIGRAAEECIIDSSVQNITQSYFFFCYFPFIYLNQNTSSKYSNKKHIIVTLKTQ